MILRHVVAMQRRFLYSWYQRARCVDVQPLGLLLSSRYRVSSTILNLQARMAVPSLVVLFFS